MKYQWLPFAELSPKEVYDILQIRENVFHLEHGALWRDIDDMDLQAKHLLGYENGHLIAYLRAYLKDECLYIDRLVVLPKYRRRGLGRMMIKKTLENLQKSYPGLDIGVQVWPDVLDFYKKCDFDVIANTSEFVARNQPVEMRYLSVS